MELLFRRRFDGSPLDTGFTITPLEWPLTIPTLWDTVRGERNPMKRSIRMADPGPSEFMDEYPQYLTRHNSLNYLSDDGGLTYNRCHCTSSCPAYPEPR